MTTTTQPSCDSCHQPISEDGYAAQTTLYAGQIHDVPHLAVAVGLALTSAGQGASNTLIAIRALADWFGHDLGGLTEAVRHELVCPLGCGGGCVRGCVGDGDTAL